MAEFRASFDFDDSFVSLCKTGVVYETRRYTVLGLKIDCPYFDLAKLNRANPDFELPVVVCTNRLFGTMLRLRTDVDLPDGDVHIGFSDPAPGFRLYLGHPTDGAAIGGSGGELLVDSSEGGSFDVSLKQWKRILRERGNGREAFVTLVAEHEGATDLEFGYAVERDGVCKGDFVTQRLTAIRSPLMADYNHNGAIDATDRELHRAGRPFRFWINEDTVRGDQSLGNENEVPNADDHFVNGKWELFRNNNPGIFDCEGDSSQKFEQYCWHKQDIWKGRASVTEGLGGTSWSGWGFARNALGLRRYSVADAQAMSLTPDVLKTNTVFRINPQSMNTNVIERIVLDAHLAQGIPAWAPATGAMPFNEMTRIPCFNLNETNERINGVPRPNGWPIFSTWGQRWLHSDMKDRAYFYVFKFYEKVIEVGGLR